MDRKIGTNPNDRLIPITVTIDFFLEFASTGFFSVCGVNCDTDFIYDCNDVLQYWICSRWGQAGVKSLCMNLKNIFFLIPSTQSSAAKGDGNKSDYVAQSKVLESRQKRDVNSTSVDRSMYYQLSTMLR